MASFLDNIAGAFGGSASVGSFASQAVRGVTVETQITPPITYRPTFDSNGQQVPPSSFNPLAYLKPKITLDLITGPVSYAPYGEPSQNYLPHLAGAVALVVAGLALLKGARAVAKTAALVGGGILVAGIARNRLA